MRHLLVALAVLLPSIALAQNESKRVKTETIRTQPLGTPTLYAIDKDGTVEIDSDVVETLVASKSDLTLLPVAQMMIAIRDRTWKPVR